MPRAPQSSPGQPRAKLAFPDAPTLFYLMPFCHLAAALHSYTTNQPPYTLPLLSTLPDMKSSITYYIELQKLYNKRAEEEKEIPKSYIQVPDIKDESDDFINVLVKNSHGIRMLRGKQWGQLDGDP